jgi:hypothetical protein
MGGRARAAQDAPADGLFNKKEEEISSFPSLSLTHFLPSFLPPSQFSFFFCSSSSCQEAGKREKNCTKVIDASFVSECTLEKVISASCFPD